MTDARFTPDLVGAVDTLVAESHTIGSGARIRWNKIKDLFLAARLAHTAVLHPSLILCHPANRGGLGLNAYNCHSLVKNIGRVGCDFSELIHATCSEISSRALERMKQLEFNAQLVHGSSGMLSPMSENEKYLSVACGHTVGGCRAIIANCISATDQKKQKLR